MSKGKPSVKITVVGDGHVGKTCMLIMYTTNVYPKNYIPTVFDNYSGGIEVEDVEYELKLWDTAGQEDYERLRPLSYPGTSCFLICYSIGSKDSYENVRSKWAPEVRHYNPHTPVILVGTKADLRMEEEDPNCRLLTEKDGRKMKNTIKAVQYLECSAKENFGLKEVIIAAVRHSKQLNKNKQRPCKIL